MFLLLRAIEAGRNVLAAHVDHGVRGAASRADRAFAVRLARRVGIPVRVLEAGPLLRPPPTGGGGRGPADLPGFEEKARRARYRLLMDLKETTGAQRILTGHTADDQVETVLMRLFKGAGIAGLKGIPVRTPDGIERPLLATWREEVARELRRRGVRPREDASNRDTRIERNWIRRVVIPLLEKRYGKAVKRRLLVLSDRFREVDEFIDSAARRWLTRNLRTGPVPGAPRRDAPAFVISRRAYGRQPALARKRILQLLFRERLGREPGERLLDKTDRLLVGEGASPRLSIGAGWILACSYEQASFIPGAEGGGRRSPGIRGRRGAGSLLPPLSHGMPAGPSCLMDRPGTYAWAPRPAAPGGGESPAAPVLHVRWRERKGPMGTAGLRRLAAGEGSAAFDGDRIAAPLVVRPLRPGDRIRPFGLGGTRKAQEILVDRKVPREQRWGRPVVCDALGRILWIPGIVRSDAAPVTAETARTVVLTARKG